MVNKGLIGAIIVGTIWLIFGIVNGLFLETLNVILTIVFLGMIVFAIAKEFAKRGKEE